MPLHIVHIVIRFLERVYRRYSVVPRGRFRGVLRSPELDRPVHRARQEQVRKVHRASERMEVDPGHRSGMPLVHVVMIQTRFGSSAVVSVRLIDVSFFRTDRERGGLVVGEVETRDGDLVGFVMARMHQLERFLRLGKHVDEPAAYHSVGTTCDEIVRVLCADHLHGVDGVCVAGCGEWGLEDREMLRAGVPE